MRRITAASCVLLFSIISNVLLAQISIHRPRMLVENQPVFKSFTFENVIPFRKEKLLNQAYQHSYHRLQGFPIPIANKENLLMSFGLGFANDQYDDQRPETIAANNNALWFQFFNSGDIGSHYFWRSLTAWGSYSTSIDLKDESNYKVSQFFTIWQKMGSQFINFFRHTLFIQL